MNTGMRYDEYSNIMLADVKCTSYGAEFGIGQSCKNTLNFRGYTLRPWPGSHFPTCIAMDPFSAFSAWLLVRGDSPGNLFCAVEGNGTNSRIDWTRLCPRTALTRTMHLRFSTLGFGDAYSRAFTGHSPKRDRVQLLRFLGSKDQLIMTLFKMIRAYASIRYVELCNTPAGTPPLISLHFCPCLSTLPLER